MAVNAAAVEVNWETYFQNIKKVCPWSYSAWQKSEIHITTWQGNIIDLGSYSARLYTTRTHNPRQLKKMTDRFNVLREHEEWLYSHPKFGINSTELAVFIQQDRKGLEQARNKYYGKV